MAFTSFRSDSGVEWCQARRYAMAEKMLEYKQTRSRSQSVLPLVLETKKRKTADQGQS